MCRQATMPASTHTQCMQGFPSLLKVHTSSLPGWRLLHIT